MKFLHHARTIAFGKVNSSADVLVRISCLILSITRALRHRLEGVVDIVRRHERITRIGSQSSREILLVER